jgi:hypothetical protein
MRAFYAPYAREGTQMLQHDTSTSVDTIRGHTTKPLLKENGQLSISDNQPLSAITPHSGRLRPLQTSHDILYLSREPSLPYRVFPVLRYNRGRFLDARCPAAAQALDAHKGANSGRWVMVKEIVEALQSSPRHNYLYVYGELTRLTLDIPPKEPLERAEA